MEAKLGIIAGGGSLPQRIVEACQAKQRPFFVLGLEGQAAPGAFDGLPHAWIRLGAVCEGVEHLRREGVQQLVFAGAVERPSLAELRPDAFATKVLAKSVLRKGDDGLLRALMEMLERELEVTFIGADTLLDDVLAPPGQLGRHTPDETCRADIARGFDVASRISASAPSRSAATSPP